MPPALDSTAPLTDARDPAPPEKRQTQRWHPPALRLFNLSRRFAVLAALTITLVSLGSSAMLSHFLSREMLQRDAENMMHFVQAYAAEHGAETYFARDIGRATTPSEIETYFKDITGLPDVLRAQAYNREGRVLWSSQHEAIEHKFSENLELEAALRGQLVVEADLLEERRYIKPEHVFARIPEKQFVEYYMPIWDKQHRQPVGVIEVYKAPAALFDSIRRGLQLIWLCGIGGGLILFGTLFWVVRRGQHIIETQQQRISGSAGFTAVGEIASAVAHNIRNPLAAIRTSAELISHDAQASSQHMAGDIMREVDRLEIWIRSLLSYAHAGSRTSAPILANDVLRALMGDFAEDMAARRIRVVWDLDDHLPKIEADALMIEQIVRTLVANALEAMPSGGVLTIGSRACHENSRSSAPQQIEIEISDTGIGIPARQLTNVFSQPRSTKAHGLGIGLPLVGRTLEHMGGGIQVSSTPGRGTSISITFPLASPKALA